MIVQSIPYPSVSSSLLSLDFMNGVYSILGVSKTLAEVVQAGDFWPYDPSDVVATEGLKAIAAASDREIAPKLTPAAIAAAVPDKDLGFTAVMTFSLSAALSQSIVSVEFGDDDPISAGWGFQPNWREIDVDPDESNLFDFDVLLDDTIQLGSAGAHKAAFTLSATRLAASFDGAAELVTGAPQAIVTGNTLQFYVASIGTGSTILKRIDLFSPVADGDLPALSA